MRQSGTIWDYLRNIQALFQPFGTIRHHLALFRAIWDYLRPFEAIWDHSGPFRTIPDYSGPFRTIPAHFGLFWTILDHFGPFDCLIWVSNSLTHGYIYSLFCFVFTFQQTRPPSLCTGISSVQGSKHLLQLVFQGLE